MLDKAIRDLDRERVGLQTQEKKLVAEIKKTAKQGQMVRLSDSSTCNPFDGVLDFQARVISTECTEVCLPSAGCCEGHGKVSGAQPACCDQDVWPQVAAAGSVIADSGKSSSLIERNS
jgi:hypothetical protein